jgi:hypothetical protein
VESRFRCAAAEARRTRTDTHFAKKIVSVIK